MRPRAGRRRYSASQIPNAKYRYFGHGIGDRLDRVVPRVAIIGCSDVNDLDSSNWFRVSVPPCISNNFKMQSVLLKICSLGCAAIVTAFMPKICEFNENLGSFISRTEKRLSYRLVDARSRITSKKKKIYRSTLC